MIFVANHKAPEVLKPGKKPFHLPSALIWPELSAILRFWLFTAFTMWSYHFNVTIIKQTLVKFITVIGFVAYEFIRGIFSKTTVYGCFNKFHFMGRSAFNVSGDRKTSSVCDCHDLGAFAALCLADSKTPFFAGTKLPSMKASRISIPPRSYRSSASSWAMRLKTPHLTHCWKRLWQVWYGGYRGGRSFHGAPVLNIHNIPFKTWRASRSLRPRGSLRGFSDRIMGSIRYHCSLVSSILIILHNQKVMSSFIFNIFRRLEYLKFIFDFK